MDMRLGGRQQEGITMVEQTAGSVRQSVEFDSTIRRSAVALALALFALNVLDLVVTDFAVTFLDAIELNPLMAPLIGTPWAIVVKVGLPIGIIALATQASTWRAVRFLRIVVAVYIVVAMITLSQVAWAVARF